ncbi:substrate-binding periplasmic protein [Parachitinimonas caeni]|uniref:Transporter substrate-binding domain-containing protein n=1 Tax=Parachitinimonas caeni TaxID=3031301 RepID=A0ABT7DU80_9NEIS|nr:transporter substrate-binding domain-containing protein [Parachitinimonas caeni]MDK2123622.1 transporter substrate-binding domain-containing protein [Parachitinimonas caeni]
MRNILFASLLLAAVPVAWAGPTQIHAVPAAPWSYPEMPGTGIVPEYFKYLFGKAGAEMTVRTIPYLRVIEGLKDGSSEATLLIPDAERDGFALNLCSPTEIHAGVLYNKSKFTPKSMNDLAGKRVGMLRGTKALDKLKTVSGIVASDIENVGQGLKMLAADRLDATFISSPGSQVLLKDAGLAADQYGFLEVDANPVALYVSRKSELFKNEALMKKLKTECEASKEFMKTLMQKYR